MHLTFTTYNNYDEISKVKEGERRSINDDESGRRGEISHYDDERWKKKRDISPTMRLK